jgi:hypothetical protein
MFREFSMRFDVNPEPSLTHRLGYRLADILWHRHFEIAELTSAILWFFWGVILVNPWADAFDSAPSFRVMASLAPELIWGLVSMVLGLNQFGAMLWEWRPWRMLASGLLLFWSLLVAVMIGWANPLGTGVVAYSVFGLLAGFAFLRSFREMG